MLLLGYDIGGTKLGISLGNEAGKIYGSARIENKDSKPEVILPQLVEISKKLVADAGFKMSDVRAFGVSAPGPADYANGILIRPPNNQYWRNVPLKKYLCDNLGIEGFFENDANCGALAEGFYGAGKGCDDFIYLTMSTGIGAGIVTGGTLVRGTGFSGGECGHTVLEIHDGRLCNCGLRGCYEAYCGGRAIAQRIQEELKDQPDHFLVKQVNGVLDDIDMRTLEAGLRAGDEYSLKLWDEVSLRNAQAFGILIDTFNPRKLILGTLCWAMGDLFLDPIRKYLPRFAWKSLIEQCELVPSALRRDIANYAGMAAALYELHKKGEI